MLVSYATSVNDSLLDTESISFILTERGLKQSLEELNMQCRTSQNLFHCSKNIFVRIFFYHNKGIPLMLLIIFMFVKSKKIPLMYSPLSIASWIFSRKYNI